MKEVFGAFIDAEVKKRFNEYCIENCMHEPSLIEKLMREFLDAKTKS